jgi:hypothetical protein
MSELQEQRAFELEIVNFDSQLAEHEGKKNSWKLNGKRRVSLIQIHLTLMIRRLLYSVVPP